MTPFKKLAVVYYSLLSGLKTQGEAESFYTW